MSKSLSLLFAVVAVALMVATAFSINTNGWLALSFGILTCMVIVAGFVIKAKQIKKLPNS
ncbi:hypothetical protein [Cohnella sp.]|uniref:hypothetical protein n=1 Tax=Cohnella sp. TaxID=1883426 RepID=UPI00356A25E6